MKLSDCKEGESVVIQKIEADEIIVKRMNLIGLAVGTRLSVARESFGSVLVVFGGKMVALGKSLAEGVTVSCE